MEDLRQRLEELQTQFERNPQMMTWLTQLWNSLTQPDENEDWGLEVEMMMRFC